MRKIKRNILRQKYGNKNLRVAWKNVQIQKLNGKIKEWKRFIKGADPLAIHHVTKHYLKPLQRQINKIERSF